MDDKSLIFGLVGVSAMLLIAIVVAAIYYRSNRSLRHRLRDVLNVDAELERLRAVKAQEEAQIEDLRSAYQSKRAVYTDLVDTVAIYDEEIELAEWGFYKPHFDFGTSEQFKDVIKEVKEKQRELVKAKAAVFCNTNWVVGGKKSEGKKMTNRSIKLTARAFNNECDAAIAKTRWNNAVTMEKRIHKAFEMINKLNATQDIHISDRYLELKLVELRLTHEYQEARQKEKDEQRELRRQEREEKKFLEELNEALKRESEYDSLLEKARKDAESASGARLSELEDDIQKLRQELAEAHERSERARSMAEQTKRGHVYVISNVGSFGEQVYKIGMTRRLDPDERVKELGDASVPFGFDVHAMIFTENAPELEGQLHKAFEDRRMNRVNTRREFFKVGLSEIRTKVEELVPQAEFVETVEARQFRESESLRAQREDNVSQDVHPTFPASI